jgi:hypothetical protein
MQAFLEDGKYVLQVTQGQWSWVPIEITNPNEPTSWLFVSCGQSNAQSSNEDPINAQLDQVIPNVYQWNRGIDNHNYQTSKDNAWIPLQYPMQHPGILPNQNHIGHQLSFSKQFLKDRPNDSIYWIACAVGGTGFTVQNMGWGDLCWKPEYAGVGRNLFHEMVEDVRSAQQCLPGSRIGAFVWVQGESDGALGGSQYQAELTNMVTQARAQLKAPNAPFICGTMRASVVAGGPAMKQIDAVHRRISQFLWLAGCGDIAKYESGVHPDPYHYNAQSQRSGGIALYKAWQVTNDEYNAALQEWENNQ